MTKPTNGQITFAEDSKPIPFRFHAIGEGKEWHWPSSNDRQFTGNTWRFLADNSAVELHPLCDDHARRAPDKPPQCDRLEIWPVRWGYPDSLVTDHPAEVEQMRQDHHAGKFELIDGSYTWQYWLENYGKAQLWEWFHTPEMERHWLNWRNGPGHLVWLHAGSGREAIRREVLQGIQFRADFHQAARCDTIWLAECAEVTLTVEELKLSPASIAQQEERIRKEEKLQAKTEQNITQGAAVAEKLTAASKEVGKASEIADLYSNPSIADASRAAINLGVPKEFVAHCFREMHLKKFPATDQAYKAVQSLPLLRALRADEAPSSRSTVGRWLRIVRKELETRGHLQKRGTGPASGKAANYDVSRHADPSPGAISLTEAVKEQERGGHTDRDTRSQELADPQGATSDGDTPSQELADPLAGT